MPKKSVTFISGFLIPSLNTKRFGNHLKWLNKEEKIFQLQWCHKSGPNWTEQEAEVFIEWDKYKGHYEPSDKSYFTKSKQRFRAMLYKLSSDGHIRKLKSTDKNLKIYCIGQSKQGRRKSVYSNEVCSELEFSHQDPFESVMQEVHLKEVCKTVPNKDMSTLGDHTYSCIDQQQNSFPGTQIGLVDANIIFEPEITLYELNEELLAKVSHQHHNEKTSFPVLADQSLVRIEFENYLCEEEKENAINLPDLEFPEQFLEDLFSSHPNKNPIIRNADVLFGSCVLENELTDQVQNSSHYQV